MTISNSLMASLTQAASYLVSKIKIARANQGLPATIDTAMTQEPARANSDGGASVDIVIDLDKEHGAPMAAAFEWGSGVHGSKGQKYIIAPKEASLLAFDWPDHDPDFPTGKKYVGYSSQGKFLFNYVEHPGVAARPYIRPSIVASMPEIKKIVGKEVKVAIINQIRQGIHGS